MDFVSKDKRSTIMKSIRSSNTKPEISLRKFLFSHGIRYRINYKKLPGKPDIVLVKYKIAVFVHGCFWHQHDNCKITNKPSSNTIFWKKKFTSNMTRDKRNKEELKEGTYIKKTSWGIQPRRNVHGKLLHFAAF